MDSVAGTSTFDPLPQAVRSDESLHERRLCQTPRSARESLAESTAVGYRRWSPVRAWKRLLRPRKKVGPAPDLRDGIRAIVWLNVMLVFVPVSWALHFALDDSVKNKDTLVFVFSFLAIMPLAQLLAFGTEELSMRVGQTLAGLLNATLGNVVELIVAIIALTKCQLRIVQSSLVGSILSNLLLVLGMCFFAGGVKFSEQGFGMMVVHVNASLLIISVIAVLLPAAFHFTATVSQSTEAVDILAVSRGTGIILLFIYGGYLFFQLHSHAALYKDNDANIIKSTRYAEKDKPRRKSVRLGTLAHHSTMMAVLPDVTRPVDVEGDVRDASEAEEEEEEEEVPKMSVALTLVLLLAVTALVAITAEFLVDSINGLTDTGRISKEFVGIILLPIAGNAAEHATAVAVAVKDKLTLSLGVAVGSSIQIALFVIPFIVTLSWILGKPLTLLFDPYESIALFFAVLTVNYVVHDGKSNWLEGMILICLYVILGLTFWYYPGADSSGILATCR